MKGPLTGTVTVSTGSITELVNSLGGPIGSPSAPAVIRVRDSVDFINATGIHVDIDGVDVPNMGHVYPLLGRVICNANADITGIIRVRDMVVTPGQGYGLTVSAGSGRFLGTLVLQQSLLDRTPPFPAVSVPASALAGQIIVNAANSTSPPYDWTGPVRIGTGAGQIILDNGSAQPNQAPYYTRASSTFGGGAVGLVPFHLHDADCVPPNGSSVPPADDPTQPSPPADPRVMLASAFSHVPGPYAFDSVGLTWYGFVIADSADPAVPPGLVAGGSPDGCPPTGAYLDFTEDGVIDQSDVDAFVTAVASGNCPWQY